MPDANNRRIMKTGLAIGFVAGLILGIMIHGPYVPYRVGGTRWLLVMNTWTGHIKEGFYQNEEKVKKGEKETTDDILDEVIREESKGTPDFDWSDYGKPEGQQEQAEDTVKPQGLIDRIMNAAAPARRDALSDIGALHERGENRSPLAEKINRPAEDILGQVPSGFLGSAASTARGLEWLTDGNLGNSAIGNGSGGLVSSIREPEKAKQDKANIISGLASKAADDLDSASRNVQDSFTRGRNPNLWDKIWNGVGSSAFFLIPGALAGKGLMTVERFAPSLARWMGASVGGVMEGFSEAGDAYKRALDGGAGKDKAGAVASKVFWANIPLDVITDKMGFFGENRLTRGAIDKAIGTVVKNPAVRRIGSDVIGGAVGRGLSELSQEAVQNPIQDVFVKKGVEKQNGNLTWKDAVRAFPEIAKEVPASALDQGVPAFFSAMIMGMPTQIMESAEQDRREGMLDRALAEANGRKGSAAPVIPKEKVVKAVADYFGRQKPFQDKSRARKHPGTRQRPSSPGIRSTAGTTGRNLR